jgi:hypothetical protein
LQRGIVGKKSRHQQQVGSTSGIGVTAEEFQKLSPAGVGSEVRERLSGQRRVNQEQRAEENCSKWSHGIFRLTID